VATQLSFEAPNEGGSEGRFGGQTLCERSHAARRSRLVSSRGSPRFPSTDPRAAAKTGVNILIYRLDCAHR